ncbi:MAG: deoxyribonuclease IV [Actinomycetia bacterium]|nr:deoxyribonuclease IV [Actinomycetes bacterium]
MAAYAQKVGCECIQIFSKSPRQWKAKPMPLHKREELAAARSVYDFGPVLTHTAYLLNVTTNDEAMAEKSVEALADELVRASILQAEGVVLHPGNVPDDDIDAATLRAARAIERSFALADESCKDLGIECSSRLLLENTAGAGKLFGSTITQLCNVIKETKVPSKRLGICFDTCHGWAAGYDVSTQAGWDEVLKELIDAGDLSMWHFAHANDCKFARGSHMDRHAWIGEGEIGFEGFKILMHLGDAHPSLVDMCVITEMPGEIPEKDIINIEALKALRVD